VTLSESDATNGQATNFESADNVKIKTLAEEIRDQLVPNWSLSTRSDTKSTRGTPAPIPNWLGSCWGTRRRIQFEAVVGSLSNVTRRIRGGTSRSFGGHELTQVRPVITVKIDVFDNSWLSSIAIPFSYSSSFNILI